MTHTGAQIEQIAKENGMKVSTVIPSRFAEVEFLAVSLETFKTALFEMDNDTFKYTYSHTYDAKTDKTTKRIPKVFK